MITVNVKMFGIFQDYFSDNLSIDISDDLSIFLLRGELLNKFKNSSFLNFEYVLSRSVFSDGVNILSDDYVLINNDIICLLPPFSGG